MLPLSPDECCKLYCVKVAGKACQQYSLMSHMHKNMCSLTVQTTAKPAMSPKDRMLMPHKDYATQICSVNSGNQLWNDKDVGTRREQYQCS